LKCRIQPRKFLGCLLLLSGLKIFLTDAARDKYRVYQLNFIGEFLQANVRGRILVSLPKVFGDIWPEFKDFSGRALEDLQEWLIEEEFMQSRASPCFFCIPSWNFHQNHYICL